MCTWKTRDERTFYCAVGEEVSFSLAKVLWHVVPRSERGIGSFVLYLVLWYINNTLLLSGFVAAPLRLSLSVVRFSWPEVPLSPIALVAYGVFFVVRFFSLLFVRVAVARLDKNMAGPVDRFIVCWALPVGGGGAFFFVAVIFVSLYSVMSSCILTCMVIDAIPSSYIVSTFWWVDRFISFIDHRTLTVQPIGPPMVADPDPAPSWSDDKSRNRKTKLSDLLHL